MHSLIEEFHYPRLGPGQMWEAMAAEIVGAGGELRLGARVERIELAAGRVRAVHAGGERIEVEHAISSLPLRDVVAIADPPPPPEVLSAARGLRYRDFLTVALVVRGEDLFPDNWVYIHDPDVRVGRIQNFRAWSEAMVPDPACTCVGLEYFCFEGDALWSASDAELVAQATRELAQIGLAPCERVEAGYVVRVPKAYPIYDEHYEERVRTVRGWLEGIENLQQIGRNGLHRYNNSDHSMLTALRAVENARHGSAHDLWAVNSDGEYHEERSAPEQPYRRAPETPALREPSPPPTRRRTGDRVGAPLAVRAEPLGARPGGSEARARPRARPRRTLPTPTGCGRSSRPRAAARAGPRRAPCGQDVARRERAAAQQRVLADRPGQVAQAVVRAGDVHRAVQLARNVDGPARQLHEHRP